MQVGKELWQHILQCTQVKCEYPRCLSSKDLLKHHQKCANAQCAICTPVKEYVRRTRAGQGSSQQPGHVGADANGRVNGQTGKHALTTNGSDGSGYGADERALKRIKPESAIISKVRPCAGDSH